MSDATCPSCFLGDRTNVAGSDLSEILPEEIEAEVKLAAEISMGTEVSEQDIGNIRHLCDQVCLFLAVLYLSSRATVVMIMACCLYPETNHVGFQSLPHLNSRSSCSRLHDRSDQ